MFRRFWSSLKDWFNPEVKERGLNGIAYALFCVVLLAGFGAQETGLTGRFEGLVGGSTAPYGVCSDCPAPSASTFHLTGSPWLVHSYYPWDSGVLGTAAVDDMDYGLGYGVSESARLPGGSWATYRYVAAGYIPGSGSYVVFSAPNRGRFAYFHLLWYEWRAVMHGNDQVGVTGWPTSPVYSGGGPYGEADAHLCVAPDALGKEWLLYGVNHPPKPKLFPAKKWSAYTHKHRLKTIRYKRHGKLVHGASLWWKFGPSKAGPAISREQYYPRAKGRRYGFMTQRFRDFRLTWWVRKPAWVKWQSVRRIT